MRQISIHQTSVDRDKSDNFRIHSAFWIHSLPLMPVRLVYLQRWATEQQNWHTHENCIFQFLSTIWTWAKNNTYKSLTNPAMLPNRSGSHLWLFLESGVFSECTIASSLVFFCIHISYIASHWRIVRPRTEHESTARILVPISQTSVTS